MNDDPIAAALRRDAELLLDLAPAPDAAALWHKVRRARSKRIQRVMDICGWSLRATVAIAFGGVALSAPEALPALIVPLALVGWLSTGICTPLLHSERSANVSLRAGSAS